MKNIIFSILILLSSFSLLAQSDKTPNQFTEEFFKIYEKNPEKAIEYIYGTNKWNTRIVDGVSQMKSEINKLTLDYIGKYYGYEILYKKELSNCFIIQSYIVKYDRQPLRFTFQYYKAKDTWGLYKFTFDTDFDDELVEANKVIYNLQN